MVVCKVKFAAAKKRVLKKIVE